MDLNVLQHVLVKLALLQYENDMKTMCRCNTILVMKSMKTYSCRGGLRLYIKLSLVLKILL